MTAGGRGWTAPPEADAFTDNPGPDVALTAGSTLIVMGRRASVADLRAMGLAPV